MEILSLFIIVFIVFKTIKKTSSSPNITVSEVQYTTKEPVKKWKELMNPSIGSIEQKCPYCKVSLSKMPSRKTRCKHCGKYYYIKKRPFDDKSVIITEDELELIEIDNLKKYGEYDDYLKEKRKFEKKERELMLSRKASFVPRNDVYWALYNEERLKVFYKRKFSDYADITEKMANLLFNEKKYKDAISMYLEAAFIFINISRSENKLIDKEWMKKINCTPRSHLLRYFVDAMYADNLSKEDIKQIFFSLDTSPFEEKNMPYSKKEAWIFLDKEISFWLNNFPERQ